MDLRSFLADIPSGAGKDSLIAGVVQSDADFNQLCELALHEKDPIAWRAAWYLDGSDEKKPGLALKCLSPIIKALPGLGSMGSRRSLLRLLTRYKIPEKDQGMLIDLCFSYLVSELYPVAVKAYAMQIIYNHVLIYPELKDELITVLKDQADNNSVAFRARGNNLIKQMEKL